MEYTDLRHALVETLTRKGYLKDARVKRAVEQVPRHLFVDADPWEAYADQAIRLKEKGERVISTISQPAVVVHMLQQLEVQSGQRILEIGAGSGYNAALLSQVTGPVGRVFTVEYDAELAIEAGRNLKSYANVTVVRGDGRLGCVNNAPYDRIIATVQATDVYQAWQDQLVEGGIVLIPLEYKSGYTRLLKLIKIEQVYTGRFGWAVNFVPMAGEENKTDAKAENDVSLLHFLARQGIRSRQKDAFIFYYSLSDLAPQEAWMEWLNLGQPQPEDFLVSSKIVKPRLNLPSLQMGVSLCDTPI